MNLTDSCFLCLDIGTTGVRGIAHRVRFGSVSQRAIYSIDSTDTIFAIKSVVNELEHQIGRRIDSAYITGNMGPSVFELFSKIDNWGHEHKITKSDILNQISKITPPTGHMPIHIIPIAFFRPGDRSGPTPVGATDTCLKSIFSTISYQIENLDNIYALVRHTFINPLAFFDPQFLHNATMRPANKTTLFIDFGAEFTGASIWTNRGPLWHVKIPIGGTKITQTISENLKIDLDEAERIKRAVSTLIPGEMDRFTPADRAYGFTCGDINDIVVPFFLDIIEQIKQLSGPVMAKHPIQQIILTGGGSETSGVIEFIENAFSLPTTSQHFDASVRALSDHIWNLESAHRNAYIARREKIKNFFSKTNKIFTHKKHTKKQPQKLVPILPSTLCFNMRRPETYTLFRSAGISMIHVDIMDGFYVDRVAGGLDSLKFIRTHTNAHLHVHLMTECPSVWASDVIRCGADTVILSTGTSGIRDAIKIIHDAGKRVGIAINPNSSVSIVKEVLRDIDEVMIMTVAPGASGQEFQEHCLKKISVLAGTRKKYGLKFLISVDGGINDQTAKLCWSAGADLLVSGSYLASSTDFPMAVQSLLKK